MIELRKRRAVAAAEAEPPLSVHSGTFAMTHGNGRDAPEAVATRLSYSETGRPSKPVIYAESSGNHVRVRLRVVPDNLFKRIR
jgi:hypothetical protein